MTNSTQSAQVAGYDTIFSAPVKEAVGLNPSGDIFAQAFFKGILAYRKKIEVKISIQSIPNYINKEFIIFTVEIN